MDKEAIKKQIKKNQLKFELRLNRACVFLLLILYLSLIAISAEFYFGLKDKRFELFIPSIILVVFVSAIAHTTHLYLDFKRKNLLYQLLILDDQ